MLPLMWLNCLYHKLKIPTTDHKGGEDFQQNQAIELPCDIPFIDSKYKK